MAPAQSSLSPTTQSATPPGAMEHKRPTRKKRTLQETSSRDPNEVQIRAPPPMDPDASTGGNKKRKEHNEVTPTTLLPAPPIFNPQLPPEQMSTPSFLHAYTSSPTPNSNAVTPSANITDTEIIMEDPPADNQEPAATTEVSLRDRLLAAKERGQRVNANATTTKDPLEKYTKAGKEKPLIYYSHPTAAFDNIDLDQILNWETRPGQKLLIHPFGHEVRNTELHPEIKRKTFAAITEITQADNVGLYAPKQGASAIDTPTVFMAYNLTVSQRRTLLEREVWSSKAITFRVTTIDPVRPDYLFSICGLATKSKEEVCDTIAEVWKTQESQEFIASLCKDLPDLIRQKTNRILEDISNSLEVKLLDTKDPGDTSAPTFNIYIKACCVPDDGLWCSLRNYLTGQEYALPFQEPGLASATFFYCTICHSVDHPRGLCKFPATEGWNGPTWRIPIENRGFNNQTRTRFPRARRGAGLTP